MHKILLLVTLPLVLFSCSPNGVFDDLPWMQADVKIEVTDLPQPAQDYLTANYPGLEVRWVKRDSDDVLQHYEVRLEGGIEIYFDTDGLVTYIDNDGWNSLLDDDIQIDPANLPAAILAYISANYPSLTIVKAEMEEDNDEPYKYEVTLSNGTELYFDAQGNLVKVDYDDDDYGSGSGSSSGDDIQIDPANLPAAILAYISANYPNLTIVKAEMEEDNDEPYKYEVTLSNGTELYFDAQGNLVMVDDDDD